MLPKPPEGHLPPGVIGGGVYPHDLISFITCHQLEGDEVGGHDSRGLYLKSHAFWLPEQGNPPLVLARGFFREHLVPRRHVDVAVVSNFHFRQDQTPNPHLCQPRGHKFQFVSPSTPNVPCCDGEGPVTPNKGGSEEAIIVMIRSQLN